MRRYSTFHLVSLLVVMASRLTDGVKVKTNSTSRIHRRVYQVPDEQRLYRNLMWGYDNSVRPVLDANDTVHIEFKITLNQITDLDEKNQVLTTNVFIDQLWTDVNLGWNPEDYNNIKTMRLPEYEVWLPDTFLYNNADDSFTGYLRGMYVQVDYNGTILWPVPVKLKSSCKVNIRYYPFDDQYCQWKFGSWIYAGDWIDFDLGEPDFSSFIDNSEWELLSIDFHKEFVNKSHFNEDHSDLQFTLHIRRRTLYYIFNVIAPCVMLSALTLLVFWLPTTSGEKISLGLSVFVAFSMFILLIAEEVPAQSETVPLIGIYLTTVMSMTSVSVIMAVMVINLYHRGSQAVYAPKWMRVFILEGLSRVLGLKHDIEKVTDNIKLEKDEEAKYACVAHPPILSRKSKFRKIPSFTATTSPLNTPKQFPYSNGTNNGSFTSASSNTSTPQGSPLHKATTCPVLTPKKSNYFNIKGTPTCKALPTYEDIDDIFCDSPATSCRGSDTNEVKNTNDKNLYYTPEITQQGNTSPKDLFIGHMEYLFKRKKNNNNSSYVPSSKCDNRHVNTDINILKNSVVSIQGKGTECKSLSTNVATKANIPCITITDSDLDLVARNDSNSSGLSPPLSPVWIRRDSAIRRDNEKSRRNYFIDNDTYNNDRVKNCKDTIAKTKQLAGGCVQETALIGPTSVTNGSEKVKCVGKEIEYQNGNFMVIDKEDNCITRNHNDNYLKKNGEGAENNNYSENEPVSRDSESCSDDEGCEGDVLLQNYNTTEYKYEEDNNNYRDSLPGNLTSWREQNENDSSENCPKLPPQHSNAIKDWVLGANESERKEEENQTNMNINLNRNPPFLDQNSVDGSGNDISVLPAITLTTEDNELMSPTVDCSSFKTSDEFPGPPTPKRSKAIPLKVADVLGTDETPCPKKTALLNRRKMVVEWQTIATVVDRLLFWISLAGTIVAYALILFVMPYSKPKYNLDQDNDHLLYKAKGNDLTKVFDPKEL